MSEYYGVDLVKGAYRVEKKETFGEFQKVINIVDNTVAPPTEVEGDRYIIDNTGASHANWDGAAANSLVQFNGTTWDASSPLENYVVYLTTLSQYWEFNGSIWAARIISSTGSNDTVVEKTFADDGYIPSNREYIVVDASGGETNINLPSLASSQNFVIGVSKDENSVNKVIINGSGGDLINDSGTYELLTNDESVVLRGGPSKWSLW